MASPFHNPESPTVKNLEAAFADDAMAHVRYRYCAELSRAAGDAATARVFDEVAAQSLGSARAHAAMLFPTAHMTPAKALQFAIEAEARAATETYPLFRNAALAEHAAATGREIDGQPTAPREPTGADRTVAEQCAERFAALATRAEARAQRLRETLAEFPAHGAPAAEDNGTS